MSEEIKDAPADAEKREMTEEEMAEHAKRMETQKKELMKFYKSEIPFLKSQCEYEELITKIEVAKMTRLDIMMAKAQMMANAPGEGEEGERKLKTD